MYELAYTPPVVSFNPRKGENPKGGKTFYVRESTGNNSHEGNDPEYPLADLETAYAKCTASQGDYIFVEYFSTLSAPPLTIGKRAIHIIALSHGNFDSRNDLNGGSSVSLNIQSAGRDLELAGFNVGNDGTANGLEIDSGQAMTRCHIHHCTFGCNFPTKDGIHSNGEIVHSSIDNCLFGNQLTGDGIETGNLLSTFIQNCIFQTCTEKGINVTVNVAGSWILGNQFYAPIASSEAAGWGITIIGGAGAMINLNYAMQTGDSTGNNPYLDTSTGTIGNTTNGWGLNYSNDTPTDPDVS